MIITGEITPIEFVTVSILKLLLLEGREGANSKLVTAKESLSILRYTVSLVQSLIQCKVTPTYLNVLQQLEKFLFQPFSEETSLSTATINLKSLLVTKLYNNLVFHSLDNLIDEIESLREVFLCPTTEISNGNKAPTVICADSPLGHTYRSFLGRFDAMSFEECCLFYDSFKTYTSNELPATNHDNSKPHCNKFSSWYGIDESVVDVQSAEAILHAFFDAGTSTLTPSSASPAAAARTLRAVSDVTAITGSHLNLNLANNHSQIQSKHQMAMFALATLWTQYKHSQLAFYSLDETMKIAHQTGDNAVIAKSLLLLHSLVSDDASGSSSGSSRGAKNSAGSRFDEDILIRCMERCVASNLPYLACQAAITLAHLKTQRELHLPGPSSQANDGSALNGGKDGEGGYSDLQLRGDDANLVSSVWNLVNLSLYGEVKALLGVARHGTRASDLLTSLPPQGGSKVPQRNPSAPGDRDPNSSGSGLLSLREASLLSLPQAMVAANLWTRLGQHGLARLQCRRVLRDMNGSYSHTGLSGGASTISLGLGSAAPVSLDMVVSLLCSLLRSLVDDEVCIPRLMPAFVSSTTTAMKAREEEGKSEWSAASAAPADSSLLRHRLQQSLHLCTVATTLIKKIRKYVQNKNISIQTENLLQSTRFYVATRNSLCILNFSLNSGSLNRLNRQTTLRHAVTYREFCTSDLNRSDESVFSAAVSRKHRIVSAANDSDTDSELHEWRLESLLWEAVALSYVDPAEALLALTEIESEYVVCFRHQPQSDATALSSRYSSYKYAILASALRLCITASDDSSRRSQNCASMIAEQVQLSSSLVFPVVEQFLYRQLSDV